MKTTNKILLLCIIPLISCTREIKESPFSKDVSVSVTTNFNSGNGFVNNTYSVKYTVKPKNKGVNFPVTATFVLTKDAKVTSGIKEYTERDTLMLALDKPRELKIIPNETGMYRLLMTFKDNKGVEIGADELNFRIVAPEYDIELEADLSAKIFVNNLFPVKYTVKSKNIAEILPVTATYAVNKQVKISAGTKEYTERDTIKFVPNNPREFSISPLETGIYNVLMTFKDHRGTILNTKELNFNVGSPDYTISVLTDLTSGGFINTLYSINYTIESTGNSPVTATYAISKSAKISAGTKEYTQQDTLMFITNKTRKLILSPSETGTYRLMMTFKDDMGTETGRHELNFNIEHPGFDIHAVTNLSAGGFVNKAYYVKYTVESKENVSNIPITAKYSITKNAAIRVGTKEYSQQDTLIFVSGKPRELMLIPSETGIYRLMMTFMDDTETEIGRYELNFNIQYPEFDIRAVTNLNAGGLVNRAYSVEYTVEPKENVGNIPITAKYSITKNAKIRVGTKEYSQQDTLMFVSGKPRELMLIPSETGTYRLMMTFMNDTETEIGRYELNFNIKYPEFDIHLETNLDDEGLVNRSHSLKYTAELKDNVDNLPITATYSITKNAKVIAGTKEYSQQDTLMFVSGKPRELTLVPTETGTYRLTMFFKDYTGTEIGKHELNFNIIFLEFTIHVETNLTEDAFINNLYFARYTLVSKDNRWNIPVTATYSISKSAKVTAGVKEYSQQDTLMFTTNKTRELKVMPTEHGTYRFLMTFKDNSEIVIGANELNFGVEVPDLNMHIVRDGNRVQNLNDTENLLEYEGSFIVRVLSEKEALNNGKLTLSANITGSSVNSKNWNDGDIKTSKAGDSPHLVDFIVDYKNINLGKTDFVFTASSKMTSVVLQDNMNIRESYPCTFTLPETSYNQEKKYYSRPQLWVGETDYVNYNIDPHPKAVSNLRRLKFEIKDPSKLSLYNGDPNQGNPQKYATNIWHDFSNRLNGKLYYMFQSTGNYSDTIYIYSQTGELGPVTKHKLFVSCRQTDDFGFEVSFKPALAGGYDEILFTDLPGITNPVTLKVTDANPFSKFDYKVTTNANTVQQGIIHRGANTAGTTVNVAFNSWLANTFGYLTGGTASGNTKSFNIICTNTPANGHVGVFNWIYDITRQSDNKTKKITRQIKIIDNRVNFSININPGGKESVYQNETSTTYRLMYDTPSLSANDYQLIITSTNANVADVYLQKEDRTFRKATFAGVETPPATHNYGGTSLGTESGRMQIKGKQPGTATLTFTLKHKASGTEKSVTKTVTTIADPIQFLIEPAPTLDAMSKERPAIPFGGQFHTYQNPRFKIRLQKSSLYSGNTEGAASVVFSTTPSLTNVARFILKGGISGNPGYHSSTNVSYGTAIEMAYDTDYWITVTAPAAHPWNVPVGSEQFLKVTMTKATNQEIKIHAESNVINYKLRAYSAPNYNYSGEVQNEGSCNNPTTSYFSNSIQIYAAGVIISSPYTNGITQTICEGTYNLKSATRTATTWNDAHEIYGNETFLTPLSTYYGFTRISTSGNSIGAIPGQTPTDPNWNTSGPGVRVTYYATGIVVRVRDNWGCSTDIALKVPNKIQWGAY